MRIRSSDRQYPSILSQRVSRFTTAKKAKGVQLLRDDHDFLLTIHSTGHSTLQLILWKGSKEYFERLLRRWSIRTGYGQGNWSRKVFPIFSPPLPRSLNNEYLKFHFPSSIALWTFSLLGYFEVFFVLTPSHRLLSSSSITNLVYSSDAQNIRAD
jgi:hypothetical protein